MVNCILQSQITTFWKYGATNCQLFPLPEIDNFPSIVEHKVDGQAYVPKPCVVERILANGHTEMFENEIIRHLAEEKWRTLAIQTWRYPMEFLNQLIFVMVLTLTYVIHYNYYHQTIDWILLSVVRNYIISMMRF